GLDYSGLLGGTGDDAGTGIDLDPQGDPYVTGYTNSGDFPTADPFQGGPAGTVGYDAFVGKFLSPTAPPRLTDVTTGSGASAHDQVTPDPALHVLGTAAANATVTLSRRDLGVLGTVTADGSGAWNYDYTGTNLGEGGYDFYAVADDGSGLTSDPSDDFLV